MDVPYDLIHRWLSNQADDQACLQLEQWLLEDPEHVTIFMEQCLDDAALKQQFLHQDVEVLMRTLLDELDAPHQSDEQDAVIMREILAEVLQRREARESAEAMLAQQEAQRHGGRQPDRRDAAPQPAQPQPSRGLVFDLAGVQVYRSEAGGARSLRRWLWAAGVLLAGVLAYIVLGTPPAPAPQNNQAAGQSQPLAQPDRPMQVATLGMSHQAAWPDGIGLDDGDRLVAGQTISLGAGLVELQMDRGAVVIVEAPFEIELIDDNRLRLNYGRLVASVPASAMRFTVDTQTAQVVDLGTDFGVQAERDGRTQAAVFSGRVELFEAEASSADPSSTNTVPQARRSIILGTGWTASVTRDAGLSERAVTFNINQQTQFSRSLSPEDLAALDYRRAVLATRPTAYWSMERHGQLRYNDWVDNRGALALAQHGAIESAPGLFGRAARFTARDGDPQYIDLASAGEIPALNQADAYSICLWFYTQQAHLGTMFSLIVPSDDPATPNSHQAQIALLESPQGPILRAVHRTPPGPDPTGHDLYGDGPYPLGQWTHVALCVDPQSARLYVNGRLMREAADPKPLRGRVALRLGTIGEVEFSPLSRRQFQGMIDEVAIYDRALTEPELLRLATPPSTPRP